MVLLRCTWGVAVPLGKFTVPVHCGIGVAVNIFLFSTLPVLFSNTIRPRSKQGNEREGEREASSIKQQ